MRKIEYEIYTVFTVKAHNGIIKAQDGSNLYKDLITLQVIKSTEKEAIQEAKALISRSDYFVTEIIQNFRRENDSA